MLAEPNAMSSGIARAEHAPLFHMDDLEEREREREMTFEPEPDQELAWHSNCSQLVEETTLCLP